MACSAGSTRGIAGGNFLQVGRQVHLFHQIEIVVAARRTIGAKSHRDAQAEQLHHRGDAAGEFHVAGGAMGDAGAARLENLHVGIVQPDAVRRDGRAVQHAQRVQQRVVGSCRASRTASSFSRLGLREMNHQRLAVFVGQLAGGLQVCVVIGVDGVRSDGGNDQRIVLVLLHEFFGEPASASCGRWRVGRLESR